MSNAYASAPEADIILSTRVRLARNYADLPFEAKIAPEEAQEVIKRAAARLCGDEDEHFTFLRMSSLDENERKVLSEKRLVSLDLLAKPETGAALVSDDETVSVMLNEEDHLRIQAMLPGLQPERAAEKAFHADDRLGAAEPFAFDAKWGYLTSLPTNAGTGMRASAILHLPALTLSKRMGALAQAVGKLGFTLRGMYGESGEADGCLYQMSNQAAIGRSEDDIVQNFLAVCAQAAEQEREERKRMIERDQDAFADKMMRTVGILLNARLMDEREFMRMYSDLRMAAGVGLLNIPVPGIDRLMLEMQPASLNALAGDELSERDRLLLRASEVRTRLTALMDDDEHME